MPYMVTCEDDNGPYGPFPVEDAAQRYAALLDIDPICRDDRHEVTWCTAIKTPEPYGDLQKAVLERIRKEGQRTRRRCVNCETPLRESATPSLDGRGLCCSADCAGYTGDERFEAVPIPGSNGCWWEVHDRLGPARSVASFTFDEPSTNKYAAYEHAARRQWPTIRRGGGPDMLTSESTYDAAVEHVATSSAVPVDTVKHNSDVPCDGCVRLAQGFMEALDQGGYVVLTRNEFERMRREVAFLESWHGDDLNIAGQPWREAFEKVNGLVSDPV